MTTLTIGRLAAASGCKVPLIRHYEKIRLLPAPARTAGRQRRYSPEAVKRLQFIRHSRQLGFSLAAIRELLSLTEQPSRPCADVDRIARQQLVEVEERLKQLQALRRELRHMIDQCAGGKVADCRVIEVLADHSQCVAEAH